MKIEFVGSPKMEKAFRKELKRRGLAESDKVTQEPRPIAAIAREIAREWPNPYFGAVPYLEAMFSLESVKDAYRYDSGDSVVRYFLSNAKTWRGEVARRVKAELKQALKEGR